MKGYGLLLLLIALLLLLIPLPALSREQAADAPAAETELTTTTTATTTHPTTATTETPDTAEATFRILCGDEVVSLTDKEFLFRTLAMEMPAAYHEEALKAQAVAAYTYYHRRRLAQAENPDPDLKGADFITPNQHFPQNYTEEKLRERWGSKYEEYTEKLTDVVEAVWGQTLTYNGQLIDACFHAVSNGQTEAAEAVWGAEVPYLQAVASPGDKEAPGYRSTAVFTPDQVKELLQNEEGIDLSDDPVDWFGEPTLSAAGTVATQSVGGKNLAGTRIRTLFGLRSASFGVAYDEEVFTFTVRGYGHGVGMSQHGANILAQQGYTYKEILQHYYTGVTLE